MSNILIRFYICIQLILRIIVKSLKSTGQTTMKKCYVVLWIPTVNHLPIAFDNPRFSGKQRINISDIPEAPMEIEISVSGKDIVISIQDVNKPKEFTRFITLEYMDSSHNGMVKYSYVPKMLTDNGFRFDESTFPEAVYHIIKGFYHIHEFHEDENDSSLSAYISTKDIDIHEANNAALQHYLIKHEETVLNLVKWGKNYLRYVIELEKQNPNRTELKIYDIFPQMYVMALGYNAYIHSLYNSIYNTGCKVSNSTEKEMRRRAFNIENSARYFNVLKAFFDTRIRQANNNAVLKKAEDSITIATNNLKETRISSRQSTKWAIAGIIISLIVGIASIIYSIYLSSESSEELNEVKNELVKILNNNTQVNDSVTLNQK